MPKIEPILYECVILRSQQHASALLDMINVKPRPIVKSLGINDSVTLQQSKSILTACCENVVNVAVWSNTRNPTVVLPFIRSHSIRRLSLRSQEPSELSFPPPLLASLTHLMIVDGPYSWFQIREAVRRAKDPSDPECLSATAQFRSLTHFAACWQNWGTMQSILKVAMNIKYFVVIVPPQFKAAPVIAQRIQEIGDRRAVLVEHSQTMENWEASIRGVRIGVWERAEKLVKDGYFAEHGEVRRKW
ncbi:hypothetical protein C0991_008903 [Blastosporella zonata]|nr:hypothetical protein C0991_008903 [Blastosporella zonata]